ncbi:MULTISPECIES: ribonuclease III [unclassified Paraburkholderia]|uniref:ribonuclease III n=1 Tax=unclassified Paraburkholderia TaxID=2615204 RepID=UPI002AB07D21|nr:MULTISPECIES: ribonuclease III [unclassified Paraburkholderia]
MRPTALEQLLDYTFSDRSLFELALTHQSASSDRNNERLEFLGDSILGGSVAALLYERFPLLSEGWLSRIRSNLVRESTLHAIAVALKLGDSLRMSDAEVSAGGLARPALLADAFEALLGGVFLDGGFPPAERLVRRVYTPILDTIDIRHFGKDPKSRLQEVLQGQRLRVPNYRVLAVSGAGHHLRFDSECVVEALRLRTIGSGLSRRAAEREAAQRMLAVLEGRTATPASNKARA